MRRIKFGWLVMATVFLLPGCLSNTDGERAKRSCYIVAKAANPTCNAIKEQQFTKAGHFSYTILYDVCGTPQAYEWGKWCENCSYRCRRNNK